MPFPARIRPAAAATRVAGVDVRVVGLSATAETLARAESVLSSAELRRAQRGVPAVRRRRILLRAALREALAEHLGMPPARVPLATTAAGRPVVVGAPGLDVSCSASSGVGLVVVADRRVGVDVERIAPWAPEVLEEGWLADSERRALADLPLGSRAEAATRAWTRKEAVLKARGTGLLEPPSAVVTPIAPHPCVVDGWAVDDLRVPPGWIASLALCRTEKDPA